jgi:hypothetical protein
MSMDGKKLQAMATDPAEFRRGLLIDTDQGPRPMADCLDPFQVADFAAIDPALKRAAGLPVDSVPHNRAWWERPRGHSKTSDAAVCALWCLFASRRRMSGVICAVDADQARLIVDSVRRLVGMNSWLNELIDVQRGRVVNRHTESELAVIPSDEASSFGLLPDLVILDEVAMHPSRGMFDSLISSAAKRSSCVVLVATNAGWIDSWAFEVRQLIADDPGWHLSALPGPIGSWITPAALAEQKRLLPPETFQRLWLNAWSSGSGTALAQGDIDASLNLPYAAPCRVSGITCVVAGLDLSLRKDHSALVTLGTATSEGRLKLLDVAGWAPADHGGTIDFDVIRQYVLEVNQRLQIDMVVYDPWNAAYMSQMLQDSGIRTMPWQFSTHNLDVMATSLLNNFMNRRIDLYPDPQLLRDLGRLSIQERVAGHRLVVPRGGADGSHCDRAVALAVAIPTAVTMSNEIAAGLHDDTPEYLNLDYQDNWLS